MTSRRGFLLRGLAGVVASGAGVGLIGPQGRDSRAQSVAGPDLYMQSGMDPCQVMTPSVQKTITPDYALALLKQGHQRFLAEAPAHCHTHTLVHGTEKGQAPFACVLSCIDSRVPVETLLDQQIGDIFVARIAGNFVNTDILGSFEYATEVAGAKAILVLGHSSCGAIKGAIDDVKMGNLTALLDNLKPAVRAAPAMGEVSSHNHALVDKVTHINVEQTIVNMTGRSPVLKAQVASGQLKVAGAIHDVHTGRITFLG
ncbi:MAG: carbonic anhydrase [Asticcacaulis sp.]